MLYTGAAFFTGAALWSSAKAINQISFTNDLENTAGTLLPHMEGESAMTALECLGDSLQILPTTDEQVLLGRVSVKETSTNSGSGVVYTYGGGGGSLGFARTSSTHHNKVQFGFPEKMSLESALGPVIAHNLDLATWDGQETKTHHYYPKESAALLRKLGMRCNFCADGYKIRSEWFNDRVLTIFGQVTRKNGIFEITPPNNNSPFIVTRDKPFVFIEKSSALAARYRGAAMAFALAAGILGYWGFELDKKAETKQSSRWS